MAERPTWRPNGIPPEQWEATSCEDQIRWWTERQPAPGPPPHPLRAVSLYERGVLTATGFTVFVFEWLTEGNVAALLAGCPADLLELLQEDSRRLPADGDERAWAGARTFAAGSYAPWVTAADIERARDAQDRAFREGLRVFRQATGGAGEFQVADPD